MFIKLLTYFSFVFFLFVDIIIAPFYRNFFLSFKYELADLRGFSIVMKVLILNIIWFAQGRGREVAPRAFDKKFVELQRCEYF